MNIAQNISFRLLKLNTDEFATFDLGNDNANPDLTIDVSFSADLDRRVVFCKMGFRITDSTKVILALKTTCLFEIEEKSWNMNVVKEEHFIIPKHILEHFCVISVGASRGILHTKTENTPFNKYIIPTLNITQLIHEDADFVRT